MQQKLEPIANMLHNNCDIQLAVNSARALSLTYFDMHRIQQKMTLLRTLQHIKSRSPTPCSQHTLEGKGSKSMM